MSETQRTEPGVMAERPVYTVASPEFFHLLQRIEQTETVLRGEIAGLRGEIKQTETSLRGEIAGVRGELAGLRSWVIATLVTVALSTIGMALFR
ncbi:MAG: hypothetical protein DDT30_02052 [Dehalococcoidia bacterium]|nr:hypothetical protein [Bacillota bacterium]MBT9143638.1 hypothetical protein [Bacillota bacterium]